jgi:putative peptidoglycan lipid II flippase
MLVQLPTIISAGFRPKLTQRVQQSTLKQVITLSLPRTLGLAMNSIALLVIVSIGSTLGVGAISIFNFSLNLETTPVGIIGISYAVASFPLLAESFTRGNMKEWERVIFSAVRQIIFWSLPLSALFIVMRAQIVRITLGSGAFSWTDTKLTAAAFALFTIGLIGQNMILVSVRAFYSAHNTKKPLIINALCAVFIVVLAIALIRVFNEVPAFRYFIESLLRVEDTPGTVVLMLPLAYSIGTLLNAWMHWMDLRKKYLTSSGQITKTFFQSAVASLVLGAVSYATLNLFAPYTLLRTFWSVLLEGAVASIAGILAAVVVLYLFKNEQLLEFASALRQKFWKADLAKVDTGAAG